MEKDSKPYTRFLKKFSEATKAEIMAVLKNEEPLTVKAISARIEHSYVTTQKRLLELVADSEVISHSIDEKTKVFFVNPEFKKEERKP